MVLTTAQAFRSFEDNIKLTSAERDIANGRYRTVKEMLTDAFPSYLSVPLSRTFKIGSVSRNTATRPLGDIDLMAVFDSKDGAFERYRTDSTRFLSYVRDRLNQRSRVERIGARGQAVRLFYSDGLWVDVAAVFDMPGDYRLPAGNGGWIRTNPIRQEFWVKEKDGELDGHLKPMVRALKRWNQEHSNRLGSWHLEVMAGRCYGYIGPDHRWASEHFFRFASIDVNDPDGFAGNLGSNLTTSQRQAVASSMRSARDRAAKAIEAEKEGRHFDAKWEWRQIFGDDFPL